MRRALVAAALACALVPAAQAQARRQHAGSCDVVAPAPEDPSLRWDYWWSGGCSAGLATGPGFLLQFMREGGFGDVYGAHMAGGRMEGEVRVYGPRFLGTEWVVRVTRWGPDGEAGDDAQGGEERLPRFALPLALQEAAGRFAREVGHPQMPGLPVPATPLRCPAFVDGDGRPDAAGAGTDVAAFIRAHASPDEARREALTQALEASAGTGGAEARRRLALAAAVSGCVQASAR